MSADQSQVAKTHCVVVLPTGVMIWDIVEPLFTL